MSRTIRIPPEPPRHIVTARAVIRNGAELVLLVGSPELGWELPGGVIEPGEDIAGGLLRHTSEQSDVQARIDRLLAIYSICDSPYCLVLVFSCVYVEGELPPNEQSAWFDSDIATAICAPPFKNAQIRDFFTVSPNIIYRAFQNGVEVRQHNGQITSGPGSDERLPVRLDDKNQRHIVLVSAFVRYGIGPILMVHYEWRGWALPEAEVQQGEDLITALQDYVEVNAGYKIVPERLAAIYCNIGEPYSIRFMFHCRLADNILPDMIGTPTVRWLRPNDAFPNTETRFFKRHILLDQLEDGLNAKAATVYYIYRTQPHYESIAEMRFPLAIQKVND